jgi:hypothetical protein
MAALKIVGGIYKETCVQPLWNAIYGSAGRAAAAVAYLVPGAVELHAYVAPEIAAEASYLALDCDATLFAASADHAISFSYLHPLSTPIIRPALAEITRHAAIHVSGDVVLRYGMLEGDAIVDAKTAIYDPQSAFGAVEFSANGSKAERLAVVMNRAEAYAMTGETDPERAARKLINDSAAAVVIVKLGSSGALVVEPQGHELIPAYQSKRVWKVGSGDVFSATFAALWGVRNMAAIEAAELASRATARYCETRSLPSPSPDDLRAANYAPVKPGHGTIYLAGPFFDLGQRWLIEESLSLLRELGASVFSPVHEVGPGPAEIVGPADIEGLERSDVVFAILNGMDSGTIFEIGYAVKKGIPVVALAQNVKDEDLKMIVGSGCDVVDDFVSALYRAVWQLPSL